LDEDAANGIETIGNDNTFKNMSIRHTSPSSGDDGFEILTGAKHVYFENITVDNFGNGFEFRNTSTATHAILKNIRIFNSLDYGIFITKTAAIDMLVYMDDVVIIDSGNYDGIYIAAGDVIIKNAYVAESGRDGIFFGDGNDAIYLDCRDSTFTRNTIGVELSGGTGTQDINLTGNSIFDNVTYDAQSNAAVDMKYNWWGTDSPTTSQFDTTTYITYSPYLKRPAIQASSYVELSKAIGEEGELYCYEDGYYQTDGTLVAWDDDYDGAVVDSETGVAIDDATVTAYRVVAGATIYDIHPPGQTKTKVDGKWIMYLDAGTYTFTVHKSGIIDDSFNRTITDS